MADPLSAIAGVAGIVAFSGQVLVKLTEYINDIHQAPKHVEQLANELMATTTALQRFKLLVIDRKSSDGNEVKKWASDSQTMLQNCEETFKQINDAVEKAQIKSKGIVKGEVVSRVKWVWNKKETEVLMVRLRGYQAVIQLMLQTMSSKQIDNIEDITEKLHELVKSMQSERANIKERLLVLDKDHPRFSKPDGVIRFEDPVEDDTDAPSPVEPSPQESLQQSWETITDNSDTDNAVTWSSFNDDVITSSAWKSHQISSLKLSRAPDPIELSYEVFGLKVVIASGISPMLEIDLAESAKPRIAACLRACLDHTTTYTYDENAVRQEFVKVPRTTTSLSSRPDPNSPLRWNATNGFLKGFKDLGPLEKVTKGLGFLPGVALTGAIDILINDREHRADVPEVITENIRQLVSVPYTVQRTGIRSAPLTQPPHLQSFESGKLWYPISFAEVKRSTFTTLVLNPNPKSNGFRREQGCLEIQCSNKAVADEVKKNLDQIIGFTKYAWLVHCDAFAPMDHNTYACSSPDEREKLAMEQEFKWSVFAAAFAHISKEAHQS